MFSNYSIPFRSPLCIALVLGIVSTVLLSWKAFYPKGPKLSAPKKTLSLRFQSPSLFPPNRSQKDAIQFAEKAVTGNWEISAGRWPTVELPIDDLWASRAVDNNSWEYELHSLFLLKHLVIAHQETGKDEYLRLGIEVIRSWHRENKKGWATSRYAWGDHTTANRAVTICAFTDYLESLGQLTSSDASLVLEMLVQHGYFLSNPTNYTRDHNHGIFQDFSLIVIASHIQPNEATRPWLNLAISRLEKQVRIQFSANGVHRENSPGYHFAITVLVRRASDYMSALGYRVPTEIPALLEKAETVQTTFIMPDGYVVPTGDSNRNRVRMKDYVEANRKMFVYPDVGYGVVQDQMYIFFHCSNQSFTHKHLDDLSIVVSDKEGPILNDVGHLNYETNDPKREYSLSWRAHNTVGFSRLGSHKRSITSGIIASGTNEQYVCFVGNSTRAHAVKHRRTLLYDRIDNTLLIFDRCTASTKRKDDTWTRYFHFEPEQHIDVLDNATRFRLRRSKGDLDLIVTPSKKLPLVLEGAETPIQGFVAQNGDLTPAPVIEEKRLGSNVYFCALLAPTTMDATLKQLDNNRVEIHSSAGSKTIEFADNHVKIHNSKAHSEANVKLTSHQPRPGYPFRRSLSIRQRRNILAAHVAGWIVACLTSYWLLRKRSAVAFIALCTVIDATAIAVAWPMLL